MIDQVGLEISKDCSRYLDDCEIMWDCEMIVRHLDDCEISARFNGLKSWRLPTHLRTSILQKITLRKKVQYKLHYEKKVHYKLQYFFAISCPYYSKFQGWQLKWMAIIMIKGISQVMEFRMKVMKKFIIMWLWKRTSHMKMKKLMIMWKSTSHIKMKKLIIMWKSTSHMKVPEVSRLTRLNSTRRESEFSRFTLKFCFVVLKASDAHLMSCDCAENNTNYFLLWGEVENKEPIG